MRISAITARDTSRGYAIKLADIRAPLTAVYGVAHSGKSAVASLVGHTLFGKHRVVAPGSLAADGELIVGDREARYRVRGSHDAAGHTRLTVAALDGAPIDHHTVRKLVGNLPAAVLTPLCAVSFHEPPDINKLLSQRFAVEFQRLASGDGGAPGTRRTSELAAHRDLLAQELETRIAAERRASKDLEARWRELDRLVREEQQHAAAAEQKLKAVENSLAETDARLRYRRIELNVELRWHTTEDVEQPAGLDADIARCRQILAELSERESSARAQLAQTQTGRANSAAALGDQQRWLAVSRQLSADLTGEVARLARAGTSQACVCRDAHPRLRPIAETIERQLAALEQSIADQRNALRAAELATEVDNLTRAQAELRRHLEQLLDRNQAQLHREAMHGQNDAGLATVFSAADAEQLESRRLQLEQDRFRLAEQVNWASRKVKVLRGERDAVERERAGLLSARSIEHVQRELAHVQRKLENAGSDSVSGEDTLADEWLRRASDFLAQLTNGNIGRLMLVDRGRAAVILNHRGETVASDMLTAAERDQVYVSLCLALLSAASQHGIWLPLVLDEPFERLEAKEMAALAAVLDSFSRQGHQVLVFTRQKEAAERLAALGAETHDMASLRTPIGADGSSLAVSLPRSPAVKKRIDEDGIAKVRRRKKNLCAPVDRANPWMQDTATRLELNRKRLAAFGGAAVAVG